MPKNNPQSGQTLIETIVAVFILSTALVTGLGLAIYSLSASAETRERIIATNLAREGIEVIRMLRDTNWLMAEDTSTGNDDLYGDDQSEGGGCMYPVANNGNGSTRRPCYPYAFDSPFPLYSSTGTNNYRVFYNPALETGWRIDGANGGENFLLCLQSDGMYRHNENGGLECLVENSRFARRVSITVGNTSFPYTPGDTTPNPTPTGNRAQNFGGHSPELVVTSTVVWQGKRCTPFTTNLDPVSFSTPCKTTMTERITNWKDYK